MARIRTWYCGYDYMKETVYVYKTEQEAASNTGTWKKVESESAAEAKQVFIERYMNEINDIAPYNDKE